MTTDDEIFVRFMYKNAFVFFSFFSNRFNDDDPTQCTINFFPTPAITYLNLNLQHLQGRAEKKREREKNERKERKREKEKEKREKRERKREREEGRKGGGGVEKLEP